MRNDLRMTTTAEPGTVAPATTGLQAVTSVFESLGHVLILLDRDFRIVHHCSLLSSTVGGSEPLLGSRIETLLGAELFGSYGAVRKQLELGERRSSIPTTLQHHEGAVSPVVMSAAPLSEAGRAWLGTDAVYVVVLKSADAAPATHPGGEEPRVAIRGEAATRDALRAVLDEYHWQRAKAAQALGISRTTLWRKMREAGLI